MIVEVGTVNKFPKFEDLKVGATFYVIQEEEEDDSLYLKTEKNTASSVNCVNLTKSTLGIMGRKTCVIEVKTKVVNA